VTCGPWSSTRTRRPGRVGSPSAEPTWYGEDSFVSSYPEPREIFIQSAHLMTEDGTIGAELPGSNGLYVRCDDVRAVEFVDGTDQVHTGDGKGGASRSGNAEKEVSRGDDAQ